MLRNLSWQNSRRRNFTTGVMRSPITHQHTAATPYLTTHLTPHKNHTMMRSLLMSALFAPLADAQGDTVCIGEPSKCVYSIAWEDTANGWDYMSYMDYRRCEHQSIENCDDLNTETAGTTCTLAVGPACDAVEDPEDSAACDAVPASSSGDTCHYATCAEYYALRWSSTENNEGPHYGMCYGLTEAAGEGGCEDDYDALTDDDDATTATAECQACIEVSTAELAAKGGRACTPEPDGTACADDLESPECRACVSKHIAANIKESPVCEWADGPNSENKVWLSYENSAEECLHTIMAMFPDPADRANMVMTWDYDCDLEEDWDQDEVRQGECWDDCYVTGNVDKDAWDALAAPYEDYTEEQILGEEWHSCYFNASYDATAAIAEAEAACSARDDVDDVEKTSGALVATASIGMIVNALVAIW